MTKQKTLMRVPQDRERRAAMRLTGRYILTVEPLAHPEITAKLESMGVSSAKSAEKGAASVKPLPRGHCIHLPRLGVSIIDPDEAQEDSLQALAAENAAVIALEPERVNLTSAFDLKEYLRGWRDATEAMVGKLTGETAVSTPFPQEEVQALPQATWGLLATKVPNSRYSGEGIRIAILDTGLDLHHPDFVGRTITTANFVGDSQPFHDGVGHGTHCTGTAAGQLRPTAGPRYGIAYDAQIFAGRVLDDHGRGGDTNILQGIHWALDNKCDIISLSLGAPWLPGDPPYVVAYEQAARAVMAAGGLMIVAAGNEYGRPGYVGAVGSPGNSPSVLTVAAVDKSLTTASFSNRVSPLAPGVKGPDLAAPGVDVYSAWPVNFGNGYNIISGTSMATPHVAGIAALMAQANPTVRGQVLKSLLISKCLPLSDGVARRGAIGAGLVQAP